jgi:hypothetical protein
MEDDELMGFSLTENATKCGSRAQNLKYGVILGAGVRLVLPAIGQSIYVYCFM